MDISAIEDNTGVYDTYFDSDLIPHLKSSINKELLRYDNKSSYQ